VAKKKDKVVKKADEKKVVVPKGRVLFFTMTSGAGHNVVAGNVRAKFEEHGFDTMTIDLFGHDPKITKMLSGYGFATMFRFPKVANFFWKRAKKRGQSIYDNFVAKVKDHIIPQINEFAPDIIVSSHVSGQILTSVYGAEIAKPFRDYFIITDYDVPPTMKPERGVESFIVMPTEDFRGELESAGYTSGQLLSFGIPINEKFYKETSKKDVLAKIDLADFDEKVPTVLMMGGGKGLGKIAGVVKQLSTNPELQIITVCGKNETLKSKIDGIITRNAGSKKPRARIYNYGFCTNVDELMAISHFSVGKTGGISSTEAIVKGLRVVSFKKIPFPELGNLRYLEDKGLAKSVKNIAQLEYYVALRPDERADSDLLVSHSAEKIVKHAMK